MADVIVVGAGPAGAAAARRLAGHGLSVTLAERKKLPRNKSCSGVLIGKSIRLVRRIFGEDVPPFALCTPTDNRGMVFYSRSGKLYRFEQPGLNVWRSAFDGWLAEKAAEAGAEICDGAAAINCTQTENSVTLELRRDGKLVQLTARYLIDCEGVTGGLKRKITHQPGDFITTFQTFNRGETSLDPHYFYAFLQPDLSQYDAWFNVKDGLLVLGTAVREPAAAPLFHRRFVQYMEESHGLRLNETLRAERWLMPRILPGCPVDWGQGRVLFAGEAAGFLNPMGEGISSALESGAAAADAVLEHFERPELAIAAYSHTAAPLKYYMERQWRFTENIAK